MLHGLDWKGHKVTTVKNKTKTTYLLKYFDFRNKTFFMHYRFCFFLHSSSAGFQAFTFTATYIFTELCQCHCSIICNRRK